MPETPIETQHPADLTCIICDRKLERSGPSEEYDAPYNGTLFTSHGHYGSTCFDPMNGDYLELTICDPCLTARAARITRVNRSDDALPKRAPWEVDDWTKRYVAAAADSTNPQAVTDLLKERLAN